MGNLGNIKAGEKHIWRLNESDISKHDLDILFTNKTFAQEVCESAIMRRWEFDNYGGSNVPKLLKRDLPKFKVILPRRKYKNDSNFFTELIESKKIDD